MQARLALVLSEEGGFANEITKLVNWKLRAPFALSKVHPKWRLSFRGVELEVLKEQPRKNR